MRLTPRQVAALVAYVECRRASVAARRLGITTGTLRGHLAACRDEYGSIERAIYVGTRDGWLRSVEIDATPAELQ